MKRGGHEGKGFRNMLRRVLIGVCAALVILVVLFETYDWLVFRPRRPAISALLETISKEEMNASDLRRLLLISLNGHEASSAARQVLIQLDVPPVTAGMLGWQATWTLWTALISLHMSKTDQLRIFVATANLGDGHRGFPAASKALYRRSLSELTQPQLATLVAMSYAPSLNSTNPGRLAQLRDWLLTKLQGGT